MGQIDIISKSLIRRLVMDMATYLLGLNIVRLEEAATERPRIETRMADIVMQAETATDERFILHIELQNSNDPHMAQRMLRYYSDIALDHPQMPIRQYCIYTGKSALNMPARLDAHGWHYHYSLIDMHQLDCQQFLQQESPDALVIAILCDFKGRDEEVILQQLIHRLIHITRAHPDQMRNYLKMMETLSANRGLTHIFKTVETKVLREIDIEQLPSYQIGLELGHERGRVEERLQVAQAAMARGLSIEDIKAFTGLTVEQLMALKPTDKE